jgi:hypothetical protein
MSYVVWLVLFFLVIMTGGVFYILRMQRARRKISDKALFLKENGKKLNIDFALCRVVHKEYYAENEKGEKTRKDLSIITFQTDLINGKMILFKTPPIFLAENNLRKRISDQKTTAVYYEPSNPSIYYFDVEFLVAFMTEGFAAI